METESCSVDKVAKTIANRRLDVSIGSPATLESAVLLSLRSLSRSASGSVSVSLFVVVFLFAPCQSINNSLRLSDLFSETRRSPRRIARKKIFRLSATAGHKCFSLCTCIMPKQNCAINIIMIRGGERGHNGQSIDVPLIIVSELRNPSERVLLFHNALL